MRFLADMGIGMDVVHALRAADHDAKHLLDDNSERLTDSEIVKKARAESRIILTHDLDFGRILALSNAQTPSVITFRLSDMRPLSVTPRLLGLIDAHAEDLLEGAAAVVTDRSVRIRVLPVSQLDR